MRNDERKGEGKRWKDLKPNISLMQECISERQLVIVTALGCDIWMEENKLLLIRTGGNDVGVAEMFGNGCLRKVELSKHQVKKYIQDVLSTPLC